MSAASLGSIRARLMQGGVLVALVVASLGVSPELLLAQTDTACVQLIYLANAKDSVNVGDTLVARRARARSCVDVTDSTRRAQALALVEPTMDALGQLPWLIPEYHDEQRLHNGSNGVGPMAYVFASPFIDGFTSLQQFSEHGTRGVLVAIVVVQMLPGETMPPTYQALHLQNGLNCFWLRRTPFPLGWAASVSHPTGPACLRTDPFAGNLRVVAHQPTGLANRTDYPAAARFSESTTNQPVVGVKCLNAWCEMGPTGFARRAPWNTKNERAAKVKGWHDEQWLIERGAGNTFVRTVQASIIPVADVDQNTLARFNTGFDSVARIVIHNNPAGTKYYAWGLRQGENLVELRRTPAGAWETRVTHKNAANVITSQQIWTNVHTHPHFDAAVPPTARFRWTIGDDGIWVPCGQQCCRSDGGY